MPDIITIGEALIDFLSVEKGVLIENTSGFSVAPGGAPANVAAAVAKLGGSAGFIGKVGKDSFGKMIKNTLEEAGVSMNLFRMDKSVNTTLAFISVKQNGEPDYTFYRNHCGADIALKKDDLDEGYIQDSKIFHFGSLSFTHEPLRSTTIRAIEIARGVNKIISFDPNLRPSLWDSLQTARVEIENGLQYADIVKLTEVELEFITGTSSLSRGTDSIIKCGPRMVLVTRGGQSSYFNNGSMAFEVPVFEVELVDATGAGDAFVGGVLLKIIERIARDQPVFNIKKDEAQEIFRFAHACGALTVMRKGVVPALPFREEVAQFLKEHSS